MHKQLADNGMHYAKFKINNREEHQSLEIQATISEDSLSAW